MRGAPARPAAGADPGPAPQLRARGFGMMAGAAAAALLVPVSAPSAARAATAVAPVAMVPLSLLVALAAVGAALAVVGAVALVMLARGRRPGVADAGAPPVATAPPSRPATPVALPGGDFSGGPVVFFRWRVAPDWPVEHVSPNVATVFGIPPGELLGGRVRFLDLVHENDRERVISAATGLCESGERGMQQEYRLVLAGGRVLHVIDFSEVVRDAAGRATHHEGYLIDMSEREAARRELQESKQRLELAVAGADLGLWDWDVQTGKVSFSDGFMAMLGYEPGELPGHLDTWSRIVHPDDLPQVMKVLQAHLDGTTHQYETEHRLQHREGHWIWVLDRGRVLQRDAEGRPLRAVGTHLDITELRRGADRFRAGLALREQTSQMLARCTRPGEITEAAQALVPDAARFVGAVATFIVRLEPARDQLQVVNSWVREPATPADASRAWATCGLCGTWWPLAEMVCEPRVLDLKRAGLPAPMYDLLRSTGTRSVALLTVNAGADVRYLAAFAARRSARSWQHHEIDFLRVMRDAFMFAQQRVELHRQNEQTREQLINALDRAEQANKVKITFLARMSHEIRTPMTAIVGLADVLRRSRADLDDAARAWLDQIQRNADHLVALLSDLLDLSKIDAGELQVSSRAVRLHEVLDAVESSLLTRAQEKGLDFRVRCAPDVPPQLVTDRLRLRQILLNLGTNAIKFTDHGRVSIDVRADVCEGMPPELVVTVRDTGLGIAEDQLELIFQPFMQVPGEDLAARGGTGLGLDISRRLARALGGDITVVSQPGLGSAFTLRLPLAACEAADVDEAAMGAAAVAAMPAPAPTVRLDGRRLLVVDDNPDNRQVISYYLKEAGATVELAFDGAEGARAARAAFETGSPFDVVLMDMRMPVLNGYRATMALRKAGVTTPIIALTAHVMEGDERACLNAGCNAYVGKPIEPTALIATVAALLPDGRATGAAGLAVGAASTSAGVPEPAAPASPGGLLSALAGDVRFAPLLERYVNGLPAQREALARARASGDRKSLADLAHKLHGTGTSFGFPAISRAAGSCEKALRGGATLESLPDLEELDALLAAASRPPAATTGGTPPMPGDAP